MGDLPGEGQWWMRRPALLVVLVALLASALLASGLTVVSRPLSATAATGETAEPVVGGPLVAPDLVAAGVIARNKGQRVEMEGLRTETSRSYANPDGSVTVRRHTGQQRFRDGQGRWVEVDLDLTQRSDGSVVPAAHPLGLRLAGGGRRGAELVAVQAGEDAPGQGRQVGVVWPGMLPRPTVEGPTATYRDITAGVDARVEATRSGFEQFFVIRDRSAVFDTFV